MKYFICVGHANYGGGVISSADGTSKGGVNEYKYNKELAPYVCKWLKAAGHEATLCIAPEGQLHSLNDEIKYFIEEEHKQNYDLSVQLHLNAFNGEAYGCEAYCYNANGLPEAQRISAKLGTVWHDRGAEERPGLYWTRKTKAKAVLVESCFGMPLKFVNIDIQPDRFAEIKFIADLIQSIENLVGSCIATVITDGGIFDHMIVFKFFSP